MSIRIITFVPICIEYERLCRLWMLSRSPPLIRRVAKKNVIKLTFYILGPTMLKWKWPASRKDCMWVSFWKTRWRKKRVRESSTAGHADASLGLGENKWFTRVWYLQEHAVNHAMTWHLVLALISQVKFLVWRVTSASCISISINFIFSYLLCRLYFFRYACLRVSCFIFFPCIFTYELAQHGHIFLPYTSSELLMISFPISSILGVPPKHLIYTCPRELYVTPRCPHVTFNPFPSSHLPPRRRGREGKGSRCLVRREFINNERLLGLVKEELMKFKNTFM